MDRFMEILTKGDPSERTMANEYLNLITQRMNSGGGKGGSPSPAVQVTVSNTEKVEDKVADKNSPRTKSESTSGLDAIDGNSSRARSHNITASANAHSDDMPETNKLVMRKEIRSRLRSAVEKSLFEMKSVDGIRVVMRENGDPEAIGIATPLLFQTGIAFMPGAAKILDSLTRLVFALGATQAVILPEGTVIGDAKVMDMRRSMGISSHLFSAGVAPARVRVNLLNTQVDIFCFNLRDLL